LKEWNEKWKETYKEQGNKGLRNLMIGSGECVALPQGLTSVGYTGRWQPGARVIDIVLSLRALVTPDRWSQFWDKVNRFGFSFA
jgi:hypothetical protein